MPGGVHPGKWLGRDGSKFPSATIVVIDDLEPPDDDPSGERAT